MKTLKVLMGALAVTFLTTTAVADDTNKDMKSTEAKFNKLDKDQDGKVSKAEAKNDSMLMTEFAAVDQDSDGYVSESEFTAMASQRPSTSTEHRSSDYTREP